MAERVLENTSTKIKNLIDKCVKCEINVQMAQTDIINIMNVIINEYKEIIENEYMNKIHIILSKIIFSDNIEMIIIELNNLNNILRRIILESIHLSQNLDWYDEVKRRMAQNNMFISELMVSQDLDYEKRIEIFKQYINNEIKIKDGNNNKEVVDKIRRLIIMLFIPIHTKATRVGKHNIKILLQCNHSGKTKETCKGRDCKYEIMVIIGYNGINEINEKRQHNHSLDYSFVTSKTCPLMKSEKEKIPKRKDEII